MFAFSQIDPETTGNVMDMEVPIGKYLGASFEAGWHSQLLTGIYRWSELQQELNDDQPKISAEEANKTYGIGDLKFDEPITDSAAALLRQRKEAEMDRNFLLTNDNHNVLAGAAGMTTSMIASMLNPIDLALMFLPVVGQAKFIGPVTDIAMLSRGNRIREAVAAGLVTREALATATRFPKFAESVIQGASYMALTEGPRQFLAKSEHENIGDPLINVISGTAMAGAIHAGLAGLGRALHGVSSRTKLALMQKAMDDFAKGEDIDIAGLAKTDSEFVHAQMDNELGWPANMTIDQLLTGPEADAQRLQLMRENIQKTFDSAIAKLRAELLPPKEPPVVPETKAQNEQVLYSSALDEIRKKNARTTAQVQATFPKAKLSREEAAVLRRQAWGESEVKAKTEANIIELLQQEKNRAELEAAKPQKGVKRLAREKALDEMPAAPKIVVEEQQHHIVQPEDKTIAPVEKQAAEAKKKATPKKPKKAKEPLTVKAFEKMTQDEYAAWKSGRDTSVDAARLAKEMTPEQIAELVKKVDAEIEATLKDVKAGKVSPEEYLLASTGKRQFVRDIQLAAGEVKPAYTVKTGKGGFNQLVSALSHDELDSLAFYFQDSETVVGDVVLNKAGDALRYSDAENARGTGNKTKGAKTSSVHADFMNWLASDAPLKERANDPQDIAIIIKAREALGIKEKSEPIDLLVPQKGSLGKKGWMVSNMPGVEASVHVTPTVFHLNNLRVQDKGKGTGSKFIEALKVLADQQGKEIHLSALADDLVVADYASGKISPLQQRLEAFYERHGFKLDESAGGIPDYVYKPKGMEVIVQTTDKLDVQTKLFVKEGKKLTQVTPEQASNFVGHVREKTGVGGSEMGYLPLYDIEGKKIGHVSYNGNVWLGNKEATGPSGLGQDLLIHNRTGLVKNEKGRWDVDFEKQRVEAIKQTETIKPMTDVIKAATDCLGKKMI